MKFNHLIINPFSSILEAMKKMDEVETKLLIVAIENTFVGLITIGDIQRALINKCNFTDTVESVMRNDYIVASPDNSIDDVKELMLKLRSEFMPVVDNKKNLLSVYFWNELFEQKKNQPLFRFQLPVVIIAGGIGSRLRPLTNVLPKPLIPLNEKTIIEDIIDRFSNHGCNTFYLSVNYKAELIEYYLNQLNLPFNLTFIRETKPLGTAGSLSLLKLLINDTFFVSNCDILIDQDYSEVLKYHKENSNEITIIAALKHYHIPYGTIDSGENGSLINLTEKPELTFMMNSGMYILESHLLTEIPEDTFFNITDLIDRVKNRKGIIGVYPVSEKRWIDIGNWNDYMKIINSNNKTAI